MLLSLAQVQPGSFGGLSHTHLFVGTAGDGSSSSSSAAAWAPVVQRQGSSSHQWRAAGPSPAADADPGDNPQHAHDGGDPPQASDVVLLSPQPRNLHLVPQAELNAPVK